ncbi:MAG: hypothetical protein AB7C96_12290 [Hydrogenovibrio sp.]
MTDKKYSYPEKIYLFPTEYRLNGQPDLVWCETDESDEEDLAQKYVKAESYESVQKKVSDLEEHNERLVKAAMEVWSWSQEIVCDDENQFAVPMDFIHELKEVAESNVKATMILGELTWEIRVPIGMYASSDEGEDALNNSDVTFSVDSEGRAGIKVQTYGKSKFMTDGDVVITELSEAAKARLGPPIQISEPDAKAKVMSSFLNGDKSYVMNTEDFQPSSFTLVDFIKQYGEGYRPDHIGNELAVISGVQGVPNE